MALQSHPRSLILASIESAYATSYWSSIVTLVLSYLALFQRYCRFSAEKSDRTAIPPEFLGVPIGLDCRCRAWLRGAKYPKLIIHIISFKLAQLIRPRYINVTDGQTDGQTDGGKTSDSNTAK